MLHQGNSSWASSTELLAATGGGLTCRPSACLGGVQVESPGSATHRATRPRLAARVVGVPIRSRTASTWASRNSRRLPPVDGGLGGPAGTPDSQRPRTDRARTREEPYRRDPESAPVAVPLRRGRADRPPRLLLARTRVVRCPRLARRDRWSRRSSPRARCRLGSPTNPPPACSVLDRGSNCRPRSRSPVRVLAPGSSGRRLRAPPGRSLGGDRRQGSAPATPSRRCRPAGTPVERAAAWSRRLLSDNSPSDRTGTLHDRGCTTSDAGGCPTPTVPGNYFSASLTFA